MEKLQREEITEKDIRIYVDMLWKRNRFSYNKRIKPLLYEFFLRSTKTFNWSKDEFLDKYINFNKIVKKIKFKDLNGIRGQQNNREKAIYISKEFLKALKNDSEITWNQFIDDFNHECLHATDMEIRDGKVVKSGLKEIKNGKEKNLSNDNFNSDTMINEYGNIISAALISSNTGLYEDNLKTLPNLNGYECLHIPGTIFVQHLMCQKEK